MTQEEILKELDTIRVLLEQEVEDENMIANYGETVSVYITRTSMLMAEAKYSLDSKKACLLMDLKDDGYQTMTLKNLVDSLCSLENRTYMIAERLNRASTHKLEWCRSRLSFYKQQISLG